ncbi:MAG: hypothetical protein H6721_27205 [Sandaracinus sp.]|nr:hypothetical protein [Sandaracinus sp.]MCB9622609.1 hypothetical protein [Sandaracinus sp.]MCB9635822.1 hypothetical protein [Sandaracinus sp.]
MTSSWFLGALAASLLVLPSPTAQACSTLLCASNALVPSTGETPIPASAPYVRLRAPGMDPGSETITATRTRDGVTEPVDVALVDGLLHLEGAREGDVWTLRESHTCWGGTTPTETISAEVRIGPASALPTTLGTLDVGETRRGPVNVADVRGSCYTPIDAASATVGVILDPSVEPFAELLVWTTEVDGRPYAYVPSLIDSTPEGRAVLLVAACEEPEPGQSPPDLEPGTHLVERLAWLPGSDVPLRASAEVTLECGEVEPTPSSSSGCATGGTGVGAWLFAFAALRRRRR